MTAATTPSRAEVLRLAGTARVIPVVRTVLADGRTPLAIHRRRGGSRPGTFLMAVRTVRSAPA
ncbi:anthranilate synthase component I, partial [Micrococcus sp. SIMBA_131]